MNLDITLLWFCGFEDILVIARKNAFPRLAPAPKPATRACAINRCLRAKKFGKKLWGV